MKPGRDLLTVRAVTGVEVARVVFRLLCGTWEPGVLMLREKSEGLSPVGRAYQCRTTGRTGP